MTKYNYFLVANTNFAHKNILWSFIIEIKVKKVFQLLYKFIIYKKRLGTDREATSNM